jgi:hypothetical protein
MTDTYKPLIEIKNTFEKVEEFKTKLRNTPSAFNTINVIDSQSMETINKLLGKYYNQPRKTTLKTITPRASESRWDYGTRIEFSKSGIGLSGKYSCILQKYTSLTKGEKSFIEQVIKDDAVFDAAKKCVSQNGQDILDKLKIIVKNNPISPCDNYSNNIKLKILPEERTLLNIGDTEKYIQLSDGYSIDIEFGTPNNNSYKSFSEDFSISSLSSAPEMFIYNYIAYNHLSEFNNALDEYVKTTSVKVAQWKKFEDDFNLELSKWLVLNKLIGKNKSD